MARDEEVEEGLDDIERRLAALAVTVVTDSDFVAYAVDDLPWLCAELRAARQQVATERAEKDAAVAVVRAFVDEVYPAFFQQRAFHSDPDYTHWQILALRILYP